MKYSDTSIHSCLSQMSQLSHYSECSSTLYVGFHRVFLFMSIHYMSKKGSSLDCVTCNVLTCQYVYLFMLKGSGCLFQCSYSPSSTAIIDLSPNSTSLACSIYWKVAGQFPVMLRQWYLSLQRQDASEIQRCVLSTPKLHAHISHQETWFKL